MADNNITKLKKEFKRIKDLGWIKSVRKDQGGIGVTFEQLIGVQENSLEIPDFGDIEIKTKRAYSKSYTGLFNCTPTGPHYHEVERLKNKFGYPDRDLKKYNVLNTSVCTIEKQKVGMNFYFKISVDRKQEKIFLHIFDKYGNLIENFVYWDFDILEEKLFRKLKKLAMIKALVKRINKEEYFKYFDLKIYELKSFNKFIELLEKGIIRITFKIGIYKSGNKIGKICDHGTSFNIKENDLHLLYDLVE